ncbi:MAG: S-layer homology domain-containing protein [Candidatus Gracilibacteria bacterium]|nr:S-layer homology domain-containing protein [Candidatus Gracilibacteria bacterium]
MSILLRKVTAAASAIAIISSALGTSVVSAAVDGKVAFAKALSNNSPKIIELSEDYRTGDNITRAEAAGTALKLKLEGELPADYTCKGTYSDVSATKPNSWACRAAELAAENGLATTANSTFRAADNITRAEALAMILKATGVAITTGTTSSSFQDVFAADWQRDVANAALEAGIASANDYFNPNNTITRGEFFVFAYNSGKKAGVVTTDKADYEDDLGLGDIIGGDTDNGTGTTSTGTTSTGTVVTAAGDLSVALNPTSPANGTQVPMNGTVRFAVVDFTAGGSDISLNSVQINKAGLASIDTTDRVWFEKNGVRVSGKTSFTTDNNAIISFAPAYIVKAGTTETLDLYVQLNEAAGNDFQFVSSKVVSSALNVSGTFATPILRTADYTVDEAVISKIGSGLSYNASNDPVELGKFTVANQKPAGVTDTRDLKFQSITLVQNENADLTSLSNVTIERNGIVVSTGTPIISGRNITISVNDTILDSVTATYTIKAVINNVDQQSGDKYQLYLKNTSDANIVETATSFRATITNASLNTTANIYTVNGGDVKFERDSSVALSSNVAPGTDNVVLMQGTLTAKSAITLEDISALGYSINGVALGAGIQNVMNTVYLQIGTSTFSWTPVSGQAASFLGSATVNGTVPVKMFTKLKNGATGIVKFNDLNLASFSTKEYVANSNTVNSAIGSIGGVTVTINASTLNVTRTDGLGTTAIPSGTKDQLVYGAKFSSTQGNPIAISNLSVTTSGTANNYLLGNTTLTLYVDGVAKSTKSLQTASVTFDNFNATVSTTTSVNIQVKASFSDVTTSGDFKIASIGYDAVDALTSNSVTQTSVAGATFNIATAVGTIAAATGNNLVNRSLLMANSKDQKIVSFQVTSQNDTIKLKDIAVTGTNLDSLSNIRLADVNMNVIAQASNVTATAANFVNLDTASGSSILDRNSATYFVIADANSNTDIANVSANITVAGSNLSSSNGSIVPMVGVNVLGAAHDVAQNTFKVTQTTPTSKSLEDGAIQFKVDAFGLNSVALTSVNVNASLGAYNPAGLAAATISLYTSDNQLVGQTVGVVNGANTIALTAPFNTINKDSSVTYVVKIVGLTLNASTNAAWTVSVTGLSVNTGAATLNAADYPKNTETLPLTSTK